MRSDEIHPGDLIAGKYRVRTVLGRNHGLLLEAFHTEFDQRVVVKILPAGHGDTKEVERFRREARTLAKLESEHVARIIDVGSQDDGSFYLVRQYLEGTDLARSLRQSGPLPLPEAVLLLAQAAEAVAETHGHGIILRELQPAHLFLTQRAGGTPLLKLIDFGTAKLMRDVAAPNAGGELTATAMFGLSSYSSPELVRKAKNVDVRADVWSLGAILYEMLTGRPPFSGEMAMLMLQITKEEPVPASQFRQDLPAEIDQILGWAMAKDVDARFRNVHALAHALTPFASSEGKVLIERIGQITQAAKNRKQGAAGGPTPVPSTPGGAPGRQAPVPPSPGAAVMLPVTTGRLCQEDSITRIKTSALTTPSEPPPPPAAGTPARASAAPSAGSPGGASAPNSNGGTGAAAAGPAAPPPPRTEGANLPVSAVSSQSLVRPLVAPPPRHDRRVLYGVLASLAVLVPVLVAIFVLSRKASTDVVTGESRSSEPVKVAAPAEPARSAEPAAAESATPVAAGPTATAAEEEATPAAAKPEKPAAVVTRINSSPGRKPTPPASPSTPPDDLPPVDYNPKPTAPTGEAPASTGSGPGTLVAVVTGGSCAFSVNGASKGTSSSIKLQMPPGSYSIMCKPSTGAAKSKSAVVKSGQTAFITFKF